MLSVYLSSDQTVCCYCLETLGPNFWRELTSWTPDTQAVCASQSEASIMSQWPIRGQDIQTGRHNHKILEIGERRRTIVSRVMWALLNIKKRETDREETGWFLVGSVVNIFIKMKNVGFIALNCLRKKLDRNSSISKLSLPGVKCETLSPAPWN